jgi:glycosyltransferase involved in cell wall biosynthesis
MNLSLCVTTYNRAQMCIDSFKEVIDDERINDILILDDCSTDGSYASLRKHFKGNEKVRVVQQMFNRGMSINKRDAIALAKNEWVIIFDDDNKIEQAYLNSLAATPDIFENVKEIYLPDFAKPTFDYRSYGGRWFDASTINRVSSLPMFGALLNTCNYVVNRDFYIKTWVFNKEMKGTDTIWHALQHLKAGGEFYVVPGMEYEHRVHDESGFMKDVDYNMHWAIELENQIKKL